MFKKNLTICLVLFSLFVFTMPSLAQDTSGGGDSNSLVEVVRAEIQPLAVLVLFTALGTGAWVILEGLRALRNRNVEVFTIVLDGVEYLVKTSKNPIDDKLFYFFRPRIERKDPASIDELRDDLNRFNR